jgi:hypothetical protein
VYWLKKKVKAMKMLVEWRSGVGVVLGRAAKVMSSVVVEVPEAADWPLMKCMKRVLKRRTSCIGDFDCGEHY